MMVVLVIWGVLSFLWAMLTLAAAASAFHEIGGYILFLMSAVCFAGAAIIQGLINNYEEIRSLKYGLKYPKEHCRREIKRALIFWVFLILISNIAHAQSAKEAIMGLKKLEARCQSGISYRDYSNAVADAKFPVNLFLESSTSKNNKELSTSISKAMLHYEMAGAFWNNKFSIWEYSVSKDSEEEIIKIYPEADKDAQNNGARMNYNGHNHMVVDFLLPVVWREASKELDNATKLYAKIEGHSSGDKDKLKKENEELKAEVGEVESKRRVANRFLPPPPQKPVDFGD